MSRPPGVLYTIGLSGQFWSQNQARWYFSWCPLIRCLLWHGKNSGNFWNWGKTLFSLILLYLFYFLYLSILLSLYLIISILLSLFPAVRVQFVYLWVCVLHCQKKSDGVIFGKTWIVIYEVENDKVKLVFGLGKSDKWDHTATVELGVQATGCLVHYWIVRAILEPKSGSVMFLSVPFDQVPPLTWKFWKL